MTVPIEPRFHVSKKSVERTYLDVSNKERKEDPIAVAKRALNRKPRKQPNSTKKFDALVEQMRREREFKQFLKERELFEEQ